MTTAKKGDQTYFWAPKDFIQARPLFRRTCDLCHT